PHDGRHAPKASAEEASAEEAEAEPDAGGPGGGGANGDWGGAISEMAGRADTVLGTRAKKVKELLYASGHTRGDIDATIEKIAALSIMFVDPSKLSSLADEFRQVAARIE
ncbi:MAG: hypothetical protein M3010_03185, partial [Candidatus Dormibacteraeota bacterium]|nr:hypothetical protein [Candidatus Dormibacteraeota bacterium]